jgi:hypothetical protein
VEHISVLSSLFFFFGCLQYSEIPVPLRQTLFLEAARSHSEQDGCSISVINFWTTNCLKERTMCDPEHFMVENPIVGPVSRNRFSIPT